MNSFNHFVGAALGSVFGFPASSWCLNYFALNNKIADNMTTVLAKLEAI